MNAPSASRLSRFFGYARLGRSCAALVVATSPGAATNVSPGLAGFSSQLPVVIIDAPGGPLTKEAPDRPGVLRVFQPTAGVTRIFGRSPATTTAITLSVRGASSAEFPKKSLNLTLRDAAGRKLAQSLLDLPASDKWALVAPWNYDPSFVNNALMYALSNRLGRWAPRTRFVEVFLNSSGDVDAANYAGIYVLTEKVEPGANRVDIAALTRSDNGAPAVTGGYILKIDSPAEDDVAWLTSRGTAVTGDSQVILIAPKAEDVTSAQRDYIRDYVQRMEDALHADQASGWTQRTSLDFIDRPSWVDHHLLNTFACNPDALFRSAYFHKPRDGRLAAGPVWDFDRALGSCADERSFRWDVWHGYGGSDVWHTGWWAVLVQDPEFMQCWVDRWQALRKAELSTAALVMTARYLASTIGPEAAARDAARWPSNESTYGSYAAQIVRLTQWLTQRAGWIDEQFVAAPELRREGDVLIFTPPPDAQLVYTLDGSDPRSVGGDIAPNALVTASALTVPANANIHVRSYRRDLRGVFPGSPWSSAAGGAHSSPLTPAGRLVNLSSRGLLGAGEQALIAGIVVADTTAKRYLARAIGPGLAAFGAGGFVSDPQISLAGADGAEYAHNAGWQNSPEAGRLSSLARSVGAFPLAAGSLDSAVVSEIAAGAYTLQATPAGGASGVGLIEIYELNAQGRTANLSTRANIQRGGEPLIGGFVVQGPAFKRVLIRAIGPTLARLGVANALEDPVMTIRAGANPVATSDRWDASPAVEAVVDASRRVGAFPLESGSEDAALLITLPPGAYTVEVAAKSEHPGITLLEIYDVP